MEQFNLAAEVLTIYEIWKNTDKEIIAQNIEHFLTKKFPECKSCKIKMEKLEEITGSQKQTVYAWINRSRKDVKIPLSKLCMISSYLEVDIKELLNLNNKSH